MLSAYLDEVFVSLQGEGLRVGERHLFVRFLGCGLGCRYCDTPAAARSPEIARTKTFCRIQRSPRAMEYDELPNPLTSFDLTDLCSRLAVKGISRPVISLTGGEPLLQHRFLAEWLPRVRDDFLIYLETAGIHHVEMGLLRDLVDIVSMDMKLPSSTGLASCWREHRKFLVASRGKDIFVKVVVTNGTTFADMHAAAELLAGHDRRIPLIIQPAGGPLAPPPEKLLAFQDAMMALVEHVRVVPQVHKLINLP